MHHFEAWLSQAVKSINAVLWGTPMITSLLGVGMYFTFRMRAPQLRLFFRSIKVILLGEDIRSDGRCDYISTFQAFATGLATRAGIGNIVGVAHAIAVGGAGAVFWMWVSAWVGMASAFAESSLAQLFKVPQRGHVFRGGPAYYITQGLGLHWLGIIFAIAMILVGFLFGNMVQVNTITQYLGNTYHWPKEWIAIVLVATLAPILIGGTRRIARVSSFLAPLLVLGYLSMAGMVVILNIDKVWGVLVDIVRQAFGMQAVLGGTTGVLIKEAIAIGIKRGLFSNEAGMGSVPNAAACSHAAHPASQGLAQMFGVFVDTMVICTATALMILLSGVSLQQEATHLTQQAIGVYFGHFAEHFITWAIFIFAFSSVLGYYVYTESNLAFIVKRHDTKAIYLCRILFLAAAYQGCLINTETAWGLADMGAAMAGMINLCVLLALSPLACLLLRDYEQQLRQGVRPSFSRRRIPQLEKKISKGVWP